MYFFPILGQQQGTIDYIVWCSYIMSMNAGMIATKVTVFVLFVKLHGVRRKGMKYWPLQIMKLLQWIVTLLISMTWRLACTSKSSVCRYIALCMCYASQSWFVGLPQCAVCTSFYFSMFLLPQWCCDRPIFHSFQQYNYVLCLCYLQFYVT